MKMGFSLKLTMDDGKKQRFDNIKKIEISPFNIWIEFNKPIHTDVSGYVVNKEHVRFMEVCESES